MDETLLWIWLTERKGIGAVTAQKYLRAFPTVTAIYHAAESELSDVPGCLTTEIKSLADKNTDSAEKIIKTCKDKEISIIPIDDHAYPNLLSQIYDPPLVLFVRGTLPDTDRTLTIGVVGTRRTSSYGIQAAEYFGSELASFGVVVVSGLAEGVDSAAAYAAIRAGGKTIGVLGTGADIVYPSWNGPLFRATITDGALISEYPPGTRGTAGNFPARNRIISGLCRGVTIIEAPLKSGSLITASRAAEQGRDVFVVPGGIDTRQYRGSHALIRDGAVLVTSAKDIIEEYAGSFTEDSTGKNINNEPECAQIRINPRNGTNKLVVDNTNTVEYIGLIEQLSNLPETETVIIKALKDNPASTDELMERTGLTAAEVLSALTMLELKGYLRISENGFCELTIFISEE
ncbi:MAG: DNA-protecting protein DprA [Clostridiales bacterium]|nr:DNA-protecting protein DprA [Clostridiales bacterium]